jgi:hypothetical protein
MEENHIYTMKDSQGWPSVSKVISALHEPFDEEGIAMRIAKGDKGKAQVIINGWKEYGEKRASLGSRTHYYLEKYAIEKYGLIKQIREPEHNCDEEYTEISENMIEAGKKFLQTMDDRGCILIDTETVLGSPELGYVGMPDKWWILPMKDYYGIIITDWKSTDQKKFSETKYSKPMRNIFSNYKDTALTKYSIQLPLYGKLIMDMLKDCKVKNIKFLGAVIVRLDNERYYEEYKCDKDLMKLAWQLNVKNMFADKF